MDRHVFTPLVDLSLEQSSSPAAVSPVNDPQDPNSENCAPYTLVYLPYRSSETCFRMTGTWTPLYSNVYYECVAKTRAADVDPAQYPSGVSGFSFSAVDDTSSVVNTRVLGPRPEKEYGESSLILFVQEKKSYLVDFWACGPGTTFFVGELSCTYYG